MFQEDGLQWLLTIYVCQYPSFTSQDKRRKCPGRFYGKLAV